MRLFRRLVGIILDLLDFRLREYSHNAKAPSKVIKTTDFFWGDPAGFQATHDPEGILDGEYAKSVHK